MGTRGCISYNPVLAIRQLGYPMREAPLEEEIAPVISRGFNKTNVEMLQKVRKAWGVLQKKDKELRGSNNLDLSSTMFFDEEALFNTPGLLDRMAESLDIFPLLPSMDYYWDDHAYCTVFNLWTD